MIPKQIARLVLAFGVLLIPAAAWAQAGASGTIAGVVKDTSAGVLPGVTVEASSPALIEKVRTVVTDDQGQYKIVDLRPGLYTVTFSLTGFNTFKREGIELTTGFTATVSAELKVGSLEETITVSGESPVVDTQNVIQQRVISREVRDALPLPSNSGAYVTIIPGATTNAANQDVGGTKGENAQAFTVHGSKSNDFQQFRDGMFFGSMVAAGNLMSSVNTTTIQEVTVLTAGGITAESQTGGAQINLVPKDGGNTFNGAINGNFGHKNLQSDNLDAALRARGATTAPFLKELHEISVGIGGPIRQDKLWYFAAARYWKSGTYQPGNYYNATQNSLFYTPDFSKPAYEEQWYQQGSVRLTWQATQKQKIVGTYIHERNCNCSQGTSGGNIAPEAAGANFYYPDWRLQTTWTYPATNRLLFEAGHTVLVIHTNRLTRGGSKDDYSVLDSSTGFRYGGPGTNLSSASGSWGDLDVGQANQKFTMSYVTGSHAFKTGIQTLYGWRDKESVFSHDVTYTFNGRTPQSVTFWATPYVDKTRQFTTALFAQDQWTISQLTLNLGVRTDSLNGWIPAQHARAGTYVPARDYAPVKDALNWKDLNPRVGAAYDLFGNGKTAVKGFLGRYVQFEGAGNSLIDVNPVTLTALSATRTWSDANGDYIPQENELGPLSDALFGQQKDTTRYANDALRGFGTRVFSWQGSVSIQHELRPGIALNIGYFRTWYGNQRVTDNQDVTPADYGPYNITAPTNAALPGGGGKVITGLYDIIPAKFGQVHNLVTLASHYGKQTDVFNGVDVTIAARFGKGGVLNGGLSTGRTVTDRCFVVDSPQEMYLCHNSPPWSAATQVKLSAVIPLPWALQGSVVYQNIPPIPTTASYVPTNTQIAPSLGRNIAACGVRNPCTSNGTAFELIPLNTYFREPRNTQVDLRLGRTFRTGRTRIMPALDLFNLMNSNPVLTMTTRYGAAWQNVTGVLPPRMIKISAQVNF